MQKSEMPSVRAMKHMQFGKCPANEEEKEERGKGNQIFK